MLESKWENEWKTKNKYKSNDTVQTVVHFVRYVDTISIRLKAFRIEK